MAEDKKILEEAVKAEDAKLKDAQLKDSELEEVAGGIKINGKEYHFCDRIAHSRNY